MTEVTNNQFVCGDTLEHLQGVMIFADVMVQKAQNLMPNPYGQICGDFDNTLASYCGC